jgi:uncharacterized protein Smg (DUF494 family)
VEESIKIVDKQEYVLCTMMIPIVMVLWSNHGVEEASWEVEHVIWSHYPHLFE